MCSTHSQQKETCLVHIGRGALREEVAEGLAIVQDLTLNLYSTTQMSLILPGLLLPQKFVYVRFTQEHDKGLEP